MEEVIHTFLLTFFTLLCAPPAFAQTSLDKLGKSTSKYIFAPEDKERASGIADVLPAVRKYSVGTGHCSLIVTSNNCHAMTAAHCLQESLSKQGNVRWEKLSDQKDALTMGFVKDGVLPATVQIDKTMKLKFLTNGEKSRLVTDGKSLELNELQMKQWGMHSYLDRYNMTKLPRDAGAVASGVELSIATTDVQVLAIGRGFSNRAPSPKDFGRKNSNGEFVESAVFDDADSYYKFVRDGRVHDLADYALVKLPGDKCTCAKTGDLQETENVVVAGYSSDARPTDPLSTFAIGPHSERSNTPFSYGDQCYTFGSQAPMITENLNLLGKIVVYAIAGAKLHELDRMNQAMSRHLKDRLIVTNARAAPGASGGAMFNSTGQLVGINTMVLQHLSGQKTVGLRIDEIKKQLKTSIGDQALEEAFRCN